MNSNCDTFIKQEFLNSEEHQIHSIPDTELSISVKNEPILDEPLSSITIKDESLVASTCLKEAVSIKTENCLQNQETVSESRNSFVIYEFETQPQKRYAASTSQIDKADTTNTTKILNSKASLISNFNQSNFINLPVKNETATQGTNSSPILLNAQLRKRHKIVLPLKPVDKRKRYNIAGKTSQPLGITNLATISTQNSKTCRLLNPGSKNVINHFIKQKLKQKESEGNCASTKSSSTINGNTKNQSTQQIEQQTTTIKDNPADNLLPVLPTILPMKNDILNITKPSADSRVIPELRVKCLCSLTEDTSSDNSEIRDFFKEMFEETRRLNKTQQRKVKMSLLKAICDAEDLVEQGKCCGF